MIVFSGLEATFNTVAAEYEKYRPGYVPELYSDLFAYAPIGVQSRVMEIGIGGGQATLPLLQTGCRLTAVEPGDRLAQICREKFADYPRFDVTVAPFQAIPEEEGYDLIFSAGAFHWIPEETGYRKVYSMLKKGGAFARFARHPYYEDGQETLFRDIQKVYAKYRPGSKPSSRYTEEMAAQRAAIGKKYGFSDIRWHLYGDVRVLTAEEYVHVLHTHSDNHTLPPREREALCSGIGEVICRHGGTIVFHDTIDLQLARKG